MKTPALDAHTPGTSQAQRTTPPQTLVELLRARAQERPESTAFRYLGDGEAEAASYSYARLDAEARRIAVELLKGGKPGDRVLMLFPAGSQFIPAFFGCLYAGMLAVPAYLPRRNRHNGRLDAVIQDAGAAQVLTVSSSLAALESLSGPQSPLSSLRRVASDAVPIAEHAWVEPAGISAKTIAFLQYTSGSTGDPKGVMVSHGNLLHNSELMRHAMGHSRQSASVSWLPTFHDMGLILGVLQPIYAGFPCTLLSPNAFLQKPLRWLKAISDTRATSTFAPNFAYELCLSKITDEEKAGLDLSSLRCLLNAAEPVRRATFERFAAAFACAGLRPEACYPAYGLAEGTLYVSGGPLMQGMKFITALEADYQQRRVAECADGLAGSLSLVACGQVFGQEARIVAPESLRPCAQGEVGEIWVSGGSVAQGYWQKPDATRETFQARIMGEAGGPYLRTGDLGFVRDGQLYVSGRLKDMIIIRGANHYPQDIEKSAEAASPDLRPGCSAAFSVEEGGEEKLVLVHELVRHPASSHAELTARLRAALSRGHDLQLHALCLVGPGSVPKTSSGKIMRRACKKAYLEGSLEALYQWRHEAPMEAESGMDGAAAWLARVAGRLAFCQAGPSDTPASVGLDSLQVAELQAGYESTFGVRAPLALFYGEKSFARIAEAACPVRPETLARAQAAAEAPLLPLQQSFYLAAAGGGQSCYALMELELDAERPLERISEIVSRVSARHPALFLKVESGERGLTQRCGTPQRHAIEKVEDFGEAVEALCLHRFDPASGILVKGALKGRRLALAFDHLATDGLSLKVWLDDFKAELSGSATALPGGEGFLGAALRRSEQRPRLAEDRAWWLEKLSGFEPAGELAPGFSGEGSGFGTLLTQVDAGLLKGLEAIAKREGLTLFSLLSAAYAKLWAFWTRQDDLAFNTPVLGRELSRTGALQSVGCYADILPLRLQGCLETPLLELARRSQQALLALQEHASVSGVELARWIADARRARPAALSPFTLTSAMFLDLAADRGVAVKSVRTGAPETALDLMVFKEGPGLALSWNHLRETISESRCARLASQYSRLLEMLAQGNTSDPLLELLDEGDLQLHANLNSGYREFPHEDVVAAFERLAKLQPDAVAVTDGARSLSYGELNARANALALRLKELGAGPERLVAIHLERSLEVVLAILGILKSGAAYLPLDPVYPKDRLNFMFQDSEAIALLSSAELMGNIEAACKLDMAEFASGGGLPNPPAEAGPENLAYVIYTSGSTGKPKGVMIRRRELSRLFSAVQPWYGFGTSDVFSMVHSYSFDVSVFEVWGALAFGGRIVVVPAMTARSAPDFYSLLDSEGVTVLSQTPSAFIPLIQEDGQRRPEARLKHLRKIIFAGEALDLSALRPWIERHGDSSPELINMYGITETTVHSSYRVIRREDAEANVGSLIGVPIPDLGLHLLDEKLRPLPEGVNGEIYVAGAGLAKGYLKRPELTAARFIESPLGRLYKSGDLARLLPSGELDYVGRSDFQVKIRGFRVELGEIQEKLRALEGVADAAVLAKEARIIAYAVAKKGAALDAGSLRQSLAAKVPDYMVPSAVVLLGALPLTENGKLDRRALPEPDFAGMSLREAPANADEEALLEIWKETLGLSQAGVTDDFFASGGHSLLAARLISRASAHFKAGLRLASFFEAPTVRGLGLALKAARSKGAVRLAAQDGPWLASPPQQSLWVLQQSRPEDGRHNIGMALELGSLPELKRLNRAFAGILKRHESLRCAFAMESSRLLRRPQEMEDFEVQAMPAAADGASAIRSATAWAGKPFDLSKAPLIRAALWALPRGRAMLGISVHHIAFDYRSQELLLSELAQECAGLPGLGQAPLDRAAEPEAAADPKALVEGWQGLLKGLDGAPLIQGSSTRNRAPEALELRLDEASLARLEAYCAKRSCSLFSALMTAWQLSLSRSLGRRDFCVGAPLSLREGAQDQAMGYFVNVLPFRIPAEAGLGFEAALLANRKACQDVLSRKDLALAELVAALKLKRSAGVHPLFQAMLVYQGDAFEVPAFDGLPAILHDLPAPAPKMDLALVAKRRQGLEARIEYDPELVSPGLAQALRAALLEALSLKPAETGAAAPQAPTVLELFRARLADAPEAEALRLMDGSSRSYAWLDAAAASVASCLAEQGLRQGARVGLYCPPGAAWVAAMLGIFEAGAVYVPLDPAYPDERLGQMIQGASLSLLLSATECAAASRLGIPQIQLDAALGRPALERRGPAPAGADAAYVIFTSGSSGLPKGVQVSHAALGNHALAFGRELGLRRGDRVLHFVSISFDASLEEVFPALSLGASVALSGSPTALAPSELNRACEAMGATVLHLPALYLHEWILLRQRDEAPEFWDLRAVVSGGEAPRPDLLERLRQQARGRLDYYNAYGPTEACISATLWKMPLQGPLPDPIPLGAPLGGVELRVVAENGCEAADGASGELWISGKGLADGYLNGASSQDEGRFTVAEFAHEGRRRYYKSGDLVRRDAEGGIAYAGRKDDQLKISGIRVQASEIEGRLQALPGVAAAVLKAESGAASAWVQPLPGSSLSEAGLREGLARSLPAALLPSRIHIMASLPRTPNGKVDRQALKSPSPGAQPLALSKDPLLAELCALWAELLMLDEVAEDANFFELGGTSLSAIRLLSRLKQSRGAALGLDLVYGAPTPRAMAARLASQPPASPLLCLRKEYGSFPLVLLHPIGGQVHCYQSLASALSGAGPIYAVQSPYGAGDESLSLRDMAAAYAGELERAGVKGPLVLGGWSMGGLIAIEMSSLLKSRGIEVERLVLLDTVFPDLYEGARLMADEAALRRLFDRDLQGQDLQGLEGELQARFESFKAHFSAMQDFRPRLVESPVTLVLSQQTFEDRERSPLRQWQALAVGGFSLKVLPGDHYSLMRGQSAEEAAAFISWDIARARVKPARSSAGVA